MAEIKKLDKAPAFRWWALVMNMLAYFYFFVTINVLYGLMDANSNYVVQEVLGISETQFSLLTTAVMITFAVVPTFGAKIASIVGNKNSVVISIVYNIVVTLLFLIPAFHDHYIMVIILRLLQGATGGLMTGTVIGQTPLWFPVRERGIASGINLAILGVGLSLDTFFGPKLIAAGFSWSTSLVILIVTCGVIVALLYQFTMKDLQKDYGVPEIAMLLPEEKTEDAKSDDTVSAINANRPKVMSDAYKTKTFWATAIYGFVNGWVVYGFTAFLPAVLRTKIDAGLVATIISLTLLSTAIASPLGGVISDKVFKGKRYQLLFLGTLLTAVTLICLDLPINAVGFVTIMAILAYASTSIVCGVFWTVPTEIVDPSISVQSSATVMTFANVGGVLAAPLLTFVNESTGTLMVSSIICILLALAASVSALIIKR